VILYQLGGVQPDDPSEETVEALADLAYDMLLGGVRMSPADWLALRPEEREAFARAGDDIQAGLAAEIAERIKAPDDEGVEALVIGGTLDRLEQELSA